MARIGRPRPSLPPVEEPEQVPELSGEEMQVDLSEPELPATFNAAGGEIDSPFATNDNADAPSDFMENIADKIDDGELAKIGDRIVQLVEQDIADREPWRQRFIKGLEYMGLVETDVDDGPFPGASNAVHPLMVEAVTQFWARAKAELFPPEGPCRAKVYGQETEEQADRAERIAEYHNFDMTVRDKAFKHESSRLLWMLPLQGSGYRKTFRDPVKNQTIGVFVPAEDIIAPSNASSLETTPRFTHRMWKWPNELRRLQLNGYYRDVDIEAPSSEETDEVTDIKAEIDDAGADSGEENVRHQIYETLIELDLPGYEHTDESGEKTGLELPYYVTVEKESRKILAIYRGWDEDDPQQARKIYLTKYSFLPGMGFYDFGFFHLIGGLQTAASGALRVLLDSAATASLSGGFVSKNSNLKGQSLVVSPGEWKTVDASSEDLAKGFFPLPVKEPSPALFNLLGLLIDAGRRFASTTEMMTGEGNSKNAPVGSTVALIEQGQKVMSTIHAGLHGSQAEELRIRHELAGRFAPPEGYPYEVGGGLQRTVFAEDFQDGIGIIPVSDPNIFSNLQRIEISRSVYQMAMESGVINIKKAVKRLLSAMKVPDADELIEEDAEPQAYDPNGEIQAIMLGKAVKVLPEQPHVEHLQALAAFAQNQGYGGHPEVAKVVGPALQSIIAQHLAYAWTSGARQNNVPAGYMDPQSGQVQDPGAPPEAIAQMMAQIAPALQQMAGLPAPPQDGADNGKAEEMQMKMQMEREKLNLKGQESQQKLQHEQQLHQLKQQMQVEKAQLDRAMAEMKMQLEQIKVKAQAEAIQQKAAVETQALHQDAQIRAQQAQQQAVIDQQTMEQQAAMTQQQMAMDQQTSQADMALKSQEQSHQQQIEQQQAMKPDPLGDLR